jgi:hypothetical protein
MMPDDSWKRDPALPWVKYEKDEHQVEIENLVNDLIPLMSVRHFKGYEEFEDEVGKHLEVLWPSFMKYFCPVGELMGFQRAVRNMLRSRIEITFDPLDYFV